MSWWDTGRGDDVIGDAPADLMIDILKEVSEKRDQQSRPKPDIQELIDGFGKALLDAPLHKAQSQAPLRVVMKKSNGRDVSANIDNADEQLVASFRTGLKEIARKYQERWQRNPRPREVAAILSFALGYEPERYLTVTGDLDLEQILAE